MEVLFVCSGSEKASSSSDDGDQEREGEDDAEAPSFVMGKR